jgi:uncharacterized NAD(P)/FAD-binding protein YdhS
MKRILIVGGGASGVLTAAHLLRQTRVPLAVTLVERSTELGAGIAYGTSHPDHLLNVRAANMSAFPDDPGHFWRWVSARGGSAAEICPTPHSFAPRRLYKEYLAELLKGADGSGSHAHLDVVHGEAVRLVPKRQGVELTLADGTTRIAHYAILATGNEGPGLDPAPWRFDGWSDVGISALAPDAAVAIVGTGLTMADRVLALLHAGHSGPITAISRRGLVSRTHRAVEAYQLDPADVPFGTHVSYITAWLRRLIRHAERSGTDWRGIIDGLRPHSQALWRSLPQEARRRFLRHARPWWDIHRHRMAPQAGDRVDQALRNGQLRVIAGRVLGFTPNAQGVDVDYLPRLGREPAVLRVDAVFECRGRAADVTATDNPLLKQLFDEGLARPDGLKLGLDVTGDCAVIDQAGHALPRVFAVGPITSGVFWEIVAVPDIRRQAAELAQHLCRG